MFENLSREEVDKLKILRNSEDIDHINLCRVYDVLKREGDNQILRELIGSEEFISELPFKLTCESIEEYVSMEVVGPNDSDIKKICDKFTYNKKYNLYYLDNKKLKFQNTPIEIVIWDDVPITNATIETYKYITTNFKDVLKFASEKLVEDANMFKAKKYGEPVTTPINVDNVLSLVDKSLQIELRYTFEKGKSKGKCEWVMGFFNAPWMPSHASDIEIVGIGKKMGDKSVSGFVISGDLSFFFCNNPALSFWAQHYFLY